MFSAGEGDFFLFPTTSRPVMYSKGVGGSFLGINRPGREADHFQLAPGLKYIYIIRGLFHDGDGSSRLLMIEM